MHDLLSKWLAPAAMVKAIEQHRLYREGSGVWARPAAALAASSMPAHGWWMQFGAAAPELQTVAMLVLSQPSSACPCETNWSTYKFVHTPERNRLDPARAESLVFVHSNLRLLRKLRAVDYYERFPVHPCESESDSDTEEAAQDGWASESSDEGELGVDESSEESEEEGEEESEGGEEDDEE